MHLREQTRNDTIKCRCTCILTSRLLPVLLECHFSLLKFGISLPGDYRFLSSWTLGGGGRAFTTTNYHSPCARPKGRLPFVADSWQGFGHVGPSAAVHSPFSSQVNFNSLYCLLAWLNPSTASATRVRLHVGLEMLMSCFLKA